MLNRRKFLGYSGALALSAALPAAAAQKQKIAPRLIPGTDEVLPVVGLGNSVSFREQDLETAANLLDIFSSHGGGYVDVGGVSRISVGTILRSQNSSDRYFLANYVDSKSESALVSEANRLMEAQGKQSLDLVHTRDLSSYRQNHALFRMLKEEGLVRYIGVARSGQDGFSAIARLISDGLVDFIQVNYSLLEPEAADRLLPLAADSGVAVSINRPFINGRYFDVVKDVTLPPWAAEFGCESWAQFSLKFIIANTAVNCVLTETANPKHAEDNLGAGYGALPDAAARARMQDFIRNL